MSIETIIKMADRSEAFIELVQVYFEGGDELREYIVQNWDFGVNWAIPDQTRLACQKNQRWPCQVRIEASLAYSAVAANQVSKYREELIALAVIYQSCIAATLDPRRVFEKVAEVSPPKVKEMLAQFLARNEEDKSLSAFLLSTRINNDGETEIILPWQ